MNNVNSTGTNCEEDIMRENEQKNVNIHGLDIYVNNSPRG